MRGVTVTEIVANSFSAAHFELVKEGETWREIRKALGRRYKRWGLLMILAGALTYTGAAIALAVLLRRVYFLTDPGSVIIVSLLVGCGGYLLWSGRREGMSSAPVALDVSPEGLKFRFASGATENLAWPKGGKRWAMLHFVTHVDTKQAAPELGAFGATLSYVAPTIYRHLPLPDAACESIAAAATAAGLRVDKRKMPFEDVVVYRSDIHR